MERPRAPDERRAIVARFERGLATLASLVEDSASGPDAIGRAAELCEAAFRDVQSLGDASEVELVRARQLLAVAIDSVQRESTFTARRLQLAGSAQRGLRKAKAPPEVGESCDISG